MALESPLGPLALEETLTAALVQLVAILAKLPAAPATEAKLEAVRASLTGTAFAEVSINSLSANQAAGTQAIVAANAGRKTLMLNPPADCVLTITSGATKGRPLFGNVPNAIAGPECPTNALFVSGLSAGQTLTIWEG
jgi:hypothetical protein